MTRRHNPHFCLPAAQVWISRWHKICLFCGSIFICFRFIEFHGKFFRWNPFKRAATKLVTFLWRRGRSVLSEIFPLVTYRRYPGPGLVPWAWEVGGREALPRAPLNSVHGLMIDLLTITYKGQVYQLLPVLVMKVHGY